MICSRCKGKDRDYPYTLYGESGKKIKFKGKPVCYHCWNMLKYGEGDYIGSKVYYRTRESDNGKNLQTNFTKGIGGKYGDRSTDEFAYDHSWKWLMNPHSDD